MTEKNDGIHDRARKKQIVDFCGIRYGAATPTDLDAFIEKNDKLFMFFEFKHRTAKLSNGQELAYVRIVDALEETSRKAVLFICRHEIDDPEMDIDAATTVVDKYYFEKKWYAGAGRTVRQLADKFYYNFIDDGFEYRQQDIQIMGVSTMFFNQDEGFLVPEYDV